MGKKLEAFFENRIWNKITCFLFPAVLIIFSAIYWFVYTVAHNGRDHNDPIGSAVLFFAASVCYIK
jgi:hypothetical protein